MRARTTVAVLVLGLAALAAEEVRAQVPDIRAFGQEARAAWSAGDFERIAAVLSPAGVRLHLDGREHPLLPVRQARAALRDFHESVGRGRVELRQAEPLGGDPPRGFVELHWTPLPERPEAPMSYTVFLGLRLQQGAWDIVEIRVLR